MQQTQSINHAGVREVPRIEQKPKTASDTAIHYGYCAYKDIGLTGSTGQEYRVQPADSPYYQNLPARELLPFTNIEVTEVDETAAAAAGYNRTVLPVIRRQKTANECISEIQTAYEAWGFTVLRPLTGFTADDAFEIFRTIQPFAFRLKDLTDELDLAVNRINETEPFEVTYEGQTVFLQPLREDLRDAAEATRQEMAHAVKTAVELGDEILQNTLQSITNFHAGGAGKRTADPHDRFIFNEFGKEIPRLISAEKQSTAAPSGETAESLEMRRREYEQREREIALRERELELKLAAVRPAPQPAVVAVAIGEIVDVGGQKGVIVDDRKPFGKVEVEFTDGTRKQVAKSALG